MPVPSSSLVYGYLTRWAVFISAPTSSASVSNFFDFMSTARSFRRGFSAFDVSVDDLVTWRNHVHQ